MQYPYTFPLDFRPPRSVHALGHPGQERTILRHRRTNVEEEIRSLKQADTEAIRARWRATVRKPFPAHLPRHLLINMLAHRLQTGLLGDLTSAELGHLRNADGEGKVSDRFDPDVTRHQPGTMFVREHAGTLHRVVKTAEGFEWNGQTFQSLSAVAFAITGTKWNGLRFFGLPGLDRARRG